MNYIDTIADKIWRLTDGKDKAIGNDIELYRIYALLALVTGEHTTNEHVHDAWSVWRTATKPDHRSLVPFDQLTVAVQELDAPYRDAIREVALAHTPQSPTEYPP